MWTRWVLPRLALLVAAPVWAAPPVVVSTSPAPGAADLPPGPTVLTVTFDQDMGAGYSLVGSPRRVPRFRGPPVWVDERTLRVEAVLAPDRDYVVWLNHPPFSGFSGVDGEPATPTLWRFSTSPAAGRPLLDFGEQLSRVRALLRERYPFPVRADVLDEVLGDPGQSPLRWLPSRRVFARRLAFALGELSDRHVSVVLAPVEYPAIDAPWAQPEPALLDQATLLAEGASARLELRPDGVVVARVFALDGASMSLLMRAFREHFSADARPRAAALVLDLRHCLGGSEDVARQIAGCFAETPLTYARTERVWDDGWRGPFERALMPRADCAFMRDVPTVVLQGEDTQSAAESLLMMADVLDFPRWGQTSAGSSGRPATYAIGRGLRVRLSTWVDARMDGTPIQGRGIEPDRPVDEGDLAEALRAWASAVSR